MTYLDPHTLDPNLVTEDGTETLTNKTIDLTNNTLTGTTVQFNTALSDDNFATLSGIETLTNKTLTTPQLNDTSSDHQYIFAVSELAADRTVTWPLLTGNDELTFNSHTQTLSNKSFDTTVKGLGGNWLISPDGTDLTPEREFVIYSASSLQAFMQFANSTTGTTAANGFLVGIGADEGAYLINQENTDMYFRTNDLRELYLDATNRGAVAGDGLGEGKGEGTFHGPNGVYSNSIELYPPTDVTGYYEGQNIGIHDDSAAATIFDIDAVIAAAWESVGPTGSGATNIWTGLDEVPATAKAVILRIKTTAVGATNADSYFVSLYGRRTGSAIGITTQSIIATTSFINRSGLSESDSTISEITLPIDASLRFDLYLATGGTSVTATSECAMVGWFE
jgi:hypothetical protein